MAVRNKLEFRRRAGAADVITDRGASRTELRVRAAHLSLYPVVQLSLSNGCVREREEYKYMPDRRCAGPLFIEMRRVEITYFGCVHPKLPRGRGA